ncbi:hypothetical protein BHM03_00002382 [Ensete ventricosum]|nr:hypothetical protein BHM03_00002382 [Ensete ventricosum]
MSQPTNHSQDVMRILPEPDVVSSDSTNSVREQLRQVNQRLDEVQRNFVRSKEEVRETTKGGSPFAPKILDKLIPSIRQIIRAQLHNKFLPEADGRLTARSHIRKRRATRPIRQQILGRDPEDARHSSYSGNPSIPDGTSALTILSVIDREAPVHGVRDVTTGEPVCSRQVIGGREAGGSQEVPR